MGFLSRSLPRFVGQALFDFYATSFDESLKGLDYSSPDVLREVVGGMKPKYREVFDAGCGTGLMGLLMRDISGERRPFKKR